jgi:hypothetical protein
MTWRRARINRKTSARIRTIPVRGKGDDAGKWFKCQWCGFMCNIDRDELRGSQDGVAGMTYSSATDVGTGDSNTSIYGGVLQTFASPALDASGAAKTIEYTYIGTAAFGCPFCGSTNWRG